MHLANPPSLLLVVLTILLFQFGVAPADITWLRSLVVACLFELGSRLLARRPPRKRSKARSRRRAPAKRRRPAPRPRRAG